MAFYLFIFVGCMMPMKEISFTLPNPEKKEKLIRWALKYKYCLYLNPFDKKDYPYGSFPNKLVFSNQLALQETDQNFESLKKHFQLNEDAELYGFLGYDLKEQTHAIKSENKVSINWPPIGLFTADGIIEFKAQEATIKAVNADDVFKEITRFLKNENIKASANQVGVFKANFNKDDYISSVKKLQNHIIEGDIYEINFCINYEANALNFDPINAFFKLSEKSPTPFGCLLKWKKQYALCASPERFIKLDENKLISQPIKGTARRSVDAEADQKIKEALRNSEKELAENMMIVDLVRNDLAQSAQAGSVKVEELFGVYSFSYLHQMISTVTGMKKPEVHPVEAIKYAFPMGSMTGAPKKSAISLIEHYESARRSIFSGAIGYINKDSFDFNVVIRSIYFDQKTGVINYQVGSAITYDSYPEAEYQECQLKAEAIKKILLDD